MAASNMTKRQIKSSTNQELIEWLLATKTIYTLTKARDAAARSICGELEARGVIDSGEALHDRWRR